MSTAQPSKLVINQKFKQREFTAKCNPNSCEKVSSSWDLEYLCLFSPVSASVLRWEAEESKRGTPRETAAPESDPAVDAACSATASFKYNLKYSKSFESGNIHFAFVWAGHLIFILQDSSIAVYDLDGSVVVQNFYFDKNPVKNVKYTKDWLLLTFENNSFLFMDAKNMNDFLQNAKVLVDALACNNPPPKSNNFPFKKWALECSGVAHEDILPLHSYQTHCVSDEFRSEFLASSSSEHPSVVLDTEEGHTFLIVGKQPSIGVYHSDQFKKHSIFTDSVIKLASTMSKVFSVAKSAITRQDSTVHSSSLDSATASKAFPKFPSVSTHLLQHFEDNQRIFTKIHDKFDRFVLISDNFGRLLLFDTKACLIVKMWKGFRGVEAFLLSHSMSLFCCAFSSIRKTFHYWKIFGNDEVGFDEWKDCPLLDSISSEPNGISVSEIFSERKLFYSINQSKIFWFES